jgi:hypothetical protein
VERAVESAKKLKSKDKKEEEILFEKKELRSSTQAATKASSSLAAVTSKGKDASRMKEMQLDVKSQLKQDDSESEPKPSCSNEHGVTKEIQSKAQMFKECLECDSSVDSENSSHNLDITSSAEETMNKDNLTSRIAAALSSQKGQWQLSCLKMNLLHVPEHVTDPKANNMDGLTCDTEQQQEDDVTSKDNIGGNFFYILLINFHYKTHK